MMRYIHDLIKQSGMIFDLHENYNNALNVAMQYKNKEYEDD